MSTAPRHAYADLACLCVVATLSISCTKKIHEQATTPKTTTTLPQPPIAKRIPFEHHAHGLARLDPYQWMRDDDRDDPEVLAYLRAETAHAAADREPRLAFERRLYDEIVDRIPQDDTSVPYRLRGYWYYTRQANGKEYDIHCRRPSALAEPSPTAGPVEDEQILLDENAEAKGEAYYAAGEPVISDDDQQMVFAEDRVGRRVYTLRFRDLARGVAHPDRIEGTSGEAVWAADSRTVFYVKRHPETLRDYQVWRHELGKAVDDDVLVFEESDEEYSVSIARSRSRELVLIGSYQTLSHEYRYIDARNPTQTPRVVLPREPEHEYDVEHARGRFYIRTNWNARDFRLMSVEPEHSGDKSRWREEIPAQAGILLRDFELFSGFAAVAERRKGVAGLRTLGWGEDGRLVEKDGHRIEQAEPIYYADLDDNPEYEATALRFGYTSLTTPWSVFDYDTQTRNHLLKKRQRVVGDFDPERYIGTRIVVPARDGTTVPVSIVHRRDLDRSRPQPLLLYGYGSYGLSIDPTFSSPRLSLLDRGFIFAIAHIRGGQEMGRAWYDDGKLLRKHNTFNDYIDCASYLIQERWTTAEKLFGQGGSAGGLLMGAVANMRPDLFAGLVAQVPFVDIVTTMLDETIPLTTFEYDEWGNPKERAFYDYMLSYSPYDNVRAQRYPHLFVLTGLHDSQVQYWEPAKWVAKLRSLKKGDERLLLHVNMDAGHGGASGRFRRHEETAMIYAFLLDLAGVRR